MVELQKQTIEKYYRDKFGVLGFKMDHLATMRSLVENICADLNTTVGDTFPLCSVDANVHKGTAIHVHISHLLDDAEYEQDGTRYEIGTGVDPACYAEVVAL